LAYTTWLALYFGLTIPAAVGWALSEDNQSELLRLFHHESKDTIKSWVMLCAYALDCADEARGLMSQLAIGV
jgi:hypothetical protein